MTEDRNDCTTKKQRSAVAVECVGILLIPQDDLKALSAEPVMNQPQECVGSLLVPCRDLQDLTTTTSDHTSQQGSNIMRRITEELQKPVTKDNLDEMDEAMLAWLNESNI
jgi:hypothetical protein